MCVWGIPGRFRTEIRMSKSTDATTFEKATSHTGQNGTTPLLAASLHFTLWFKYIHTLLQREFNAKGNVLLYGVHHNNHKHFRNKPEKKRVKMRLETYTKESLTAFCHSLQSEELLS